MSSKVQQREQKQETSGPVLTRPSSGAHNSLHAAPHPQARLRQLQPSIGNQRMSRMLQKKLVVGPAGDEYERQADRVAEAVTSESAQPSSPPRFLRAPQQAAPVQRKCSCGGTCSSCQEEEEEKVQRKEAASAASSQAVNDAPPIVDEVLRSPGQPLDPATRAYFEPRFGYDFSGVRVHADNYAAESARSVNSLAYTVGHDLVFGSGQYAPPSKPGQRLLAHELSHVVQQGNNKVLQRQKHEHKETKPKSSEPKKEEAHEATAPSAGAQKALQSAQNLRAQTDPAVWFDSWGNDLRDNNLNGKIDDKSEQGLSDGSHHSKVFEARVCKDPSDTTDLCPATDQSRIKVSYKVCIDVPIESYKAAGVSISTSRWIPTFFSELSKRPDWTVWKKPARPSQLLDGDIVAASNPDHQHAGIAETGMIYDSVLNLPGPTTARKFHLFAPSGKNDMKSVPRVLFESFLSIDWIARSKK